MLKEGLTHTSVAVVCEDNTALKMGSGDLDVFATPAMIALMENAAMKTVATFLPEGSTTVGSQMDALHIKPSPIGNKVSATAILINIDNRKLTFSVQAKDGDDIIGEGTHIRFIVDKIKFMNKLK